jgi:hypothetical protein
LSYRGKEDLEEYNIPRGIGDMVFGLHLGQSVKHKNEMPEEEISYERQGMGKREM